MTVTDSAQRTWTTIELIAWSAEYLNKHHIDSPRLTAELLLAHALGCDRIGLYTRFEKILSPEDLAKYKLFLKRRLAHEPVQYITGEAWFMGLRFDVDKRVLIPRPETEILVEQVIDSVRANGTPSIRILDIGTGSGCIAVSLAHFIKEAVIDAVDISVDALAVAKGNAIKHNLGERIRFQQKDILAESTDFDEQRYDIVVSNPPYISTEEFALVSPEVRDFEPQVATTDRFDGLTFYRAIASKCEDILKPGGYVFLEMGYNQRGQVFDILHQHSFAEVVAVNDYAKIPRVVRARLAG